MWSKDNFVTVYSDDDKEYVLSLPFYLIILMSKMKDRIQFKSDFTEPRLIDMLYETLCISMTQFGLFLSYHSDSGGHYGQLLPENPWQIMSNFKVGPEIAYRILRPRYKSLYKFETREWTDLVAFFKKTFDEFPFDNIYLNPREPEPEDKVYDYLKNERSKIWQFLSPDLYTLFWLLEPENLTVPIEM